MLNVVEDVDGVLCKVLIDLLTYARLKIRWRIQQLVGVWSYIVISMEHSLLLGPVFTPTWTDLPSFCTRCYPSARASPVSSCARHLAFLMLVFNKSQ